MSPAAFPYLPLKIRLLPKGDASVQNNASTGGDASAQNNASTANGITATAKVSNPNIKYVTFLVNGKKAASEAEGDFIAVSNGTASIALDHTLLETADGAWNTIEVLGAGSTKNYINNEKNFTAFTVSTLGEPDPAPIETILTGTVSITSSSDSADSYPGDTLTAQIKDSNNTGSLSYQWYADGTAINGAANSSFQLTNREIGKTISVQIRSSVETGILSGAYTGKIQKKAATTPPPSATKVTLSAKTKKLQVYQTFQLKASITPKAASQKVTF